MCSSVTPHIFGFTYKMVCFSSETWVFLYDCFILARYNFYCIRYSGQLTHNLFVFTKKRDKKMKTSFVYDLCDEAILEETTMNP
ncbi:hypothetical protein QVD17_13756 [Tagetes erecta]|uniref:Uncharacterized protein n=1 Tax=Tagetes erecta TaxID=13708 RepID=A0AAD8L0Y3_TARER|nr:hypothetical protein QVD17_13756 [Tagetes erecta]